MTRNIIREAVAKATNSTTRSYKNVKTICHPQSIETPVNDDPDGLHLSVMLIKALRNSSHTPYMSKEELNTITDFESPPNTFFNSKMNPECLPPQTQKP